MSRRKFGRKTVYLSPQQCTYIEAKSLNMGASTQYLVKRFCIFCCRGHPCILHMHVQYAWMSMYMYTIVTVHIQARPTLGWRGSCLTYGTSKYLFLDETFIQIILKYIFMQLSRHEFAFIRKRARICFVFDFWAYVHVFNFMHSLKIQLHCGCSCNYSGNFVNYPQIKFAQFTASQCKCEHVHIPTFVD